MRLSLCGAAVLSCWERSRRPRGRAVHGESPLRLASRYCAAVGRSLYHHPQSITDVSDSVDIVHAVIAPSSASCGPADPFLTFGLKCSHFSARCPLPRPLQLPRPQHAPQRCASTRASTTATRRRHRAQHLIAIDPATWRANRMVSRPLQRHSRCGVDHTRHTGCRRADRTGVGCQPLRGQISRADDPLCVGAAVIFVELHAEWYEH